jgi:4-hydroxy 2-oxovalerate aldolase
MMLMDVTLRDGGYVTDHHFPLTHAQGIVAALAQANIDYLEVGYFRRNFANHPDYIHRLGSFISDQDYLNQLGQYAKQLVLMVRPGDTYLSDYETLVGTNVKVLRFAVAPRDMKMMLPHILEAKRLHFKVAVNLIRASEEKLETILEMGRMAQDNGLDWFYIADSNGALFPHHVAKIIGNLRDNLTIPIGFHAHDGLSLAFINTLTAFEQGAVIADASLGGLGKGGNLLLELMAMYLNTSKKTSFNILKLCEATSQYITPWLGDACLMRNENAAAAILNMNLERLTAFREEARVTNQPLWFLLASAVQDKTIG